MRFKEWIGKNPYVGTENVESKIDQIYDKAKYSIKLVQIYNKQTNQRLLNNITTIAPLQSGVYGLYNSAENKKVIGPSIANKINFKFGQNVLNQNSLQTLPNTVIKKYIPDIDEKQLVPSDVIHVNVRKIVQELGDGIPAIIEIASTIVHEATHEIEFQATGKTNEIGPKKAEKAFKIWVQKNWNFVLSQIPQLKTISIPQ